MSTFKTALKWLGQGIDLVPLQPGSKHLVGGFGAYLGHISTREKAAFWFEKRSCNLGLVLGSGLVCLDFDDIGTYKRLMAQWSTSVASYTERTRRGVHVYFLGESDTWTMDMDGIGHVEVLGRGKVVTVAPSHVSGFEYRSINGFDLSRIPAAFSLLSEKSAKPLSREKQDHQGDDLIGRIKAAYDLLEIAQQFPRVGLKQGRDARWWHGYCPFHPNSKTGKRNLWLDVQRGTWGCFACSAHGDVINLYARLHGLEVRQAIQEMAKRL